MLGKMDDNSESTNVPDYKKIMQTNQSAGSQNSSAGHIPANWNGDLDTLTQRQLGSTDQHILQQHRLRPGLYSWNNKKLQSSKSSWDAPLLHPASSKLRVSDHDLTSTYKDEPSFIPQGYTRPVMKYTDANGVQHRVIKRTLTPNRKSFTEGLNLVDDSGNYSSGTLRAASSQKNLLFGYSGSGYGVGNDGGNYSGGREGSSARHGFSHVNLLPAQTGGDYSGSGKLGGSRAEQWKDIGGSHVGVKNPQDDLRHWQQQHQEELLHQHLETQALYESPNTQSINTNIDHGLGRASLLQDKSPARWEPVRRAADTIIKEKNMIIEKLKNRILELEEDFKLSEDKLRQGIASKEDDVNIVRQKLQEVQHKHATLKEQLSEERSKKNAEIDDLEIKLGSAEHEVQQLKELLRNKDLRESDIQAQVAEKTKEIESWKQKFSESCSGHQDLKKKLDSLQRYLDELPTVDESRIQAQQLLSLREENIAMKAKCEGQEKKLMQARKIITSRDFRVRELEEREKELEKKIEEVSRELERLQDGEGSELYNTQKELKTVRADKERLAIDLEKAKKLIETTHQKVKQVEAKYQAELSECQDRLKQEEGTVDSLRADGLNKEREVHKITKSMKELGMQNQELLEQCLLLKEQLRHVEGKGADMTTPLQQRLMLQLRLCFNELQALVQVCSQRARGEDPDMSILLGVKSTESMENPDSAAGGGGGHAGCEDPAKVVTQWLGLIAQLRREVDKLRAHICNKYAEDMGNNITCATQ